MNRSMVMKMAWKKFRQNLGKTFGECLRWAWAVAKDNRAMAISEWVYDKAQQTARNYNMWIDFLAKANGLVTVVVDEVIAETEKAIQVKLATGDVVGSAKGWKLWIPKSQIA